MIFEKITEDMKNAMKAKDIDKLETLRLIFSQIKNAGIDSGDRDKISDELALETLKRRLKQGKDAVEQYKNGGRQELVDREQKQLDIISIYVPEMMNEADIEKVVRAKKEVMGIIDTSKMGQLIGVVMQELKGKADGTIVRQVVEKVLN